LASLGIGYCYIKKKTLVLELKKIKFNFIYLK
jgi:hypothetical protein